MRALLCVTALDCIHALRTTSAEILEKLFSEVGLVSSVVREPAKAGFVRFQLCFLGRVLNFKNTATELHS